MTREEVKKLAEIIKKGFDLHDPSTIEEMMEVDPDEAVKEIIPKYETRIKSVFVSQNSPYGGYCLTVEAYANDEPTIEERLMSAIKEAGLLEEETLVEDGDDEEQYYDDYEDDPDWDVDDEMVETPKEDGTAKNATHYQNGEIQPIEYMQDKLSKEGMLGYIMGNIDKYNHRTKGEDLKDAEKLVQYAKWKVDVLRGKKIDPRK